MMYKQDNNISIIIKNLQKKASQTEAEALQNLKNTDGEFSSLFNDLEEIWDITGKYTPDVSIDVESAFDKFAANYELPIDSINVNTVESNRPKQYVAYLIALLLILISSFVMYNNLTSTDTIGGDENHNGNYSVPVAAYQNFGDIDNILLSPNTNLIVDTKNNKILNVEGNAYFELSDRSSVQLGDASISGENVDFTVSNYKNESAATVSVKSGELEFAHDSKLYEATEGHSLVVDKTSGSVEITETEGNLSNNITWVDGNLIFVEAYLGDVFTDVEKYFGVNIDIEGNIPNNGKFELNSPYNPISSADELFELIKQVEINIHVASQGNNSYIVRSQDWK